MDVETRWRVVILAGVMVLAVSKLDLARADNFGSVIYDPVQDELVVTMAYQGTNPDHTFSLQWGNCESPDDASETTLGAEVLDDQFEDAARQPFTKTTHFSLADIPCRPVKLTLRTAPRFLTTVRIPAKQ